MTYKNKNKLDNYANNKKIKYFHFIFYFLYYIQIYY
jgi:hypothetical protein